METRESEPKEKIIDQALSELAKLIMAGIDERNKPYRGGVRKKRERRNDRGTVDVDAGSGVRVGKVEGKIDP